MAQRKTMCFDMGEIIAFKKISEFLNELGDFN